MYKKVNYWFPQSVKIQPKDLQKNKASELNFEREPFNYKKTVNLFNLSKVLLKLLIIADKYINYNLIFFKQK
jgi:hypothetical protein